MLRTLIVDDSRVFRTILAKALEGHPAVKVVASEFSGERGLARLKEGGIDLVLLDMNMPGLSGLDFLKQMRTCPRPRPVVLVLSASYQGTEPEALEALSAGASAFVPKNAAGPAGLMSTLQDELARLGMSQGRPSASRSKRRQPTRSAESIALGEMVGIVSSTGGPAALQVLLGGLDAKFDVPIAIVQHLPSGFAPSMAANLTRRTGREVKIASHGDRLVPGSIFVAPGDKHLEIARDGAGLICKLVRGPKENGCCPAGDRMIRTAARATGGRMAGVCLTGMGCDGASGLLELSQLGGQVIVQDERSSIVWGMPSSVLDAGVPAIVLPLEGISASLNRKANRKAA